MVNEVTFVLLRCSHEITLPSKLQQNVVEARLTSALETINLKILKASQPFSLRNNVRTALKDTLFLFRPYLLTTHAQTSLTDVTLSF